MHFNESFGMTAACMMTFVISAAASATIRTFDGGAGTCDWHTAANWHPDSVPDDPHYKAIIPNGYSVCLDDDVTVGALDVAETARLTIAANSPATLTIDRGTISPTETGLIVLQSLLQHHAVIEICDGALEFKNNNLTAHQIGGAIILASSTSQLLIRTDDARFAPYGLDHGSVIGQHDDARIDIGAGRTLVNEITIEGAMRVGPQPGQTATLVNERSSISSASGVVRSNAGGVLKFEDNLSLDDTSFVLLLFAFRPVWMADSAGGSRLEFNEPAASLVGNFLVYDCATLQFNASVTTCGQLRQHGMIDVNSDACFCHECGQECICAEFWYPNPCN